MLRCVPDSLRPARYATIHRCRHELKPLTECENRSRVRRARLARVESRLGISGFQTMSGQAGFSQKGDKFHTCCCTWLEARTFCHMLPHVAICCRMRRTRFARVNRRAP